MKKYYLPLFLALLFSVFYSCSNEEETDYIDVATKSAKAAPNAGTASINIDITQVPFVKLSDYHFFIGALKNQTPGYLVIPFKPASALFSDYAHKKRFVWMPSGTHATYNGDDNVLEFPVGTVLIKTFYYDNVQPSNTTQIIETRLLVRKSDGWKLYDYIWNDSQTEAFLDTNGNGGFVPITWLENSVLKSTTYHIPSQTECITCHKINPNGNAEITIPIGPKPQNLNTMYNYGNITKNQLERWKGAGYINNTLPATSAIISTVDWEDTSKPLSLRARSYLDINCAHCHRDGGECSYVPQRLNFSNTDSYTYGICLPPLGFNENPYVINAGNASHSAMIARMNTNDEAEMMPLIGRTVIHDEGVQLVSDWINSLTDHCN